MQSVQEAIYEAQNAQRTLQIYQSLLYSEVCLALLYRLLDSPLSLLLQRNRHALSAASALAHDTHNSGTQCSNNDK
jgi:hypothetical protein